MVVIAFLGSRIKRRTWCVLVAIIVVGVLALVLVPRKIAVSEPSPTLLAASHGLDEVVINGVFSPDTHTMDATQLMHIQNRTGQSLSELILRTYANAFLLEDTSPAAIEENYDECYSKGFSVGGIDVKQVLVNGKAASISYKDKAKTVLSISLDTPLAPDEKTELSLEYCITIPQCAYRFGYMENVYQLGNAFPHLAVFEEGAFRTEEYYPIGDPFVSDCANYRVQLTVPEGYTVCATGHFVQEGQQFTFSALAVRDFACVISNKYQVAMDKVGDVLIASYAKTRQKANKALEYAKKAIDIFNRQIGAYPYQTFSLAEISFPFGGMEYPQMVMLSDRCYEANKTLESVIAHETAHQWWYAVVGSDQYYQPWQDEALSDYSVFNYIGERYGEDDRQTRIFNKAEISMRVNVPRGITPGTPLDSYGSFSEYSLVAYNRGSAMLVALETAVGREKIDAFLQTYYAHFQFKRASRADFESTLYEVAEQDLSELVKDYLDTYIVN